MTNYQTQEQDTTPLEKRNPGNGHIWTGIFLIIVGGAALARSLSVPIPYWLFTWQTFLITLGVFIGIRSHFHGAAWLIMILIGAAFLINDFYPTMELRNRLWPLIIICIGAIFILRPKKKKQLQWRMEAYDNAFTRSKENFADVTTIFGSTKKAMTTKQFAGGDITCLFAGTELDLTDADLQGQVIIDVTAIFGGVELIIPAHWTIKSDVTSVFGSVKDNRVQSSLMTQDPEKVIILDGTAMFGGIEIRSFKK